MPSYKDNLRSSLCQEAIKYIYKLYRIEHLLENKNASIEEIYQTRQKDFKMVLDEYKLWLQKNYPNVPPQTALGKAMAYSMNRMDNLSNYLLDCRLPIDINLALSKILDN